MKYKLGLNIIVDEELKRNELIAIQKGMLDTCKCLAQQLDKNICFIFYENDESKPGLMSVNWVDRVLTTNVDHPSF